MESTPIEKLSPLAVKELCKQLDRSQCEEGTWREFAGYSYGATFQNILEIENKPGSPTNIVFDCWLESETGLNVGHLFKILKKIGRCRAIDKLCCLYEENRLSAPISPSPTHQSSPLSSSYDQSNTSTSSSSCHQSSPLSSSYDQSNTSTSSSSCHQSISSSPSPQSLSLSSDTSSNLATLLLSFSGSMLHGQQINQFAICLQNATGYMIVLDQRRSWVNQKTKETQLYEKFTHAAFVICLIDEEYVKEAEEQSTSEMQTNTRFITQLMSDEFKENCDVNSRFLPYLLDASMSKTFPPFLDNPPLGPYEHFQKILAKQLEKVQLEKQIRQINDSHYHNTSCQPYQTTAVLHNQSVHSSCVSQDVFAARTNSNYGPVMDRNVEHYHNTNSYNSQQSLHSTAPSDVHSSYEGLSQFMLTRKNRNFMQVADHNVNVEQANGVKIKQNAKKKSTFDNFKKLLKNQRQRPCKATETNLIIHKKQR